MAKKETRPFGLRDKLAYAAGDLGCNMSFALKSTVQIFWLVFMAMETEVLAVLLLIVQIWDAVNDPILGTMIDRDTKKYKYGKFKTYIFIGACGLLVGGAAVFLPFPKADLWVKCVLFIVGYMIWDAFYTIANVPYGSMLSLVTEDTAERAQLSTWRSIGSMIGNMLPGIILPFIIWNKITYDGSTDFLSNIVIPEGSESLFAPENFHKNPITGAPYNPGDKVLSPLTGEQIQVLLGDRVFWAALIMGVLGFICFFLMLKFITVRADENSVKTTEVQKFNVFKAFGAFMKNRPALGATVAAMGMFLGMQSATTANTIMFATYFGDAPLAAVVQIIGFLPMMLFIPFVKKLVEKFGKKEASAVGCLVSLLGAAIMCVFPLVPKNIGLIIYMVGLVFFGIGMGFYTCVSWAMMGDAIDYNEWKTGKREEGTVYALHSFFRKLAQGVGPTVVLLIMGWLGYQEALGTIGQEATTAANMTWLVAGLYLFSAVAMFLGIAVIYNLDKKTLEKMNAELAERRAAAVGGETVEVEAACADTCVDACAVETPADTE